MTTSDMRWRKFALDLKNLTVTANGENNELSDMIKSNATLLFDTIQPSQRLTCVLNKFYYTNQHTYT